MTKELKEKYEALKKYFAELGSVAIAFSGGVDSTFMLKVAHDVLGDKAIAITARSHSFPERENKEAVEFCRKEAVSQFFVDMNELAIPGFSDNPKNRCYICKKEIFGKIIETARFQKIAFVCEGSNLDDNGDYRPGLQAVAELNVKSPLRECNLWKAEIRELSKELKLETWSKPSFACLASRFVYGEKITAEKLAMIEKAEQVLLDLGFVQERVRIHSFGNDETSGTLARIEVVREDFEKVIECKGKIVETLKKIGFNYVSLDLEGYRTGSMNETLKR